LIFWGENRAGYARPKKSPEKEHAPTLVKLKKLDYNSAVLAERLISANANKRPGKSVSVGAEQNPN